MARLAEELGNKIAPQLCMLNDLSKEQQLILLGLILVIAVGLGVMAFRYFSPSGSGDSQEVLIMEPQGNATIVANLQIASESGILVHVAGAVKQEGVYKLKTDDRIIDAINLAGGADALADLSSINLAEKVKDGQKVNIPVKRITAERISGQQDIRISEKSSGRININTADEKELCKVSGIGPTTAKRIIEYRSTNGQFSKIEDIMKVKSIGKSKFGKIKDSICL